jgi:adenosylcobinamide-GDP ribazoletransferase
VSTVRNAVALLTRFPVASPSTDRPGAAAFGLVGAFVGVAGAVPLAALAGPAGEPWLGSVAAVAVMVVVTGALHVDGLADTADALVARDPVAAERARRDPTLGVGGVLAIVLVVAGELAALTSLSTGLGAMGAGLVLVAVAAVSRVVPVLVNLGGGRSGSPSASTLGSWFAARVTATEALLSVGSAVLLAAGLTIVGGGVVTVGAASAALLGIGLAAVIVALRGGLDGDGMGAIVELSMVAGLAGAAVVVV